MEELLEALMNQISVVNCSASETGGTGQAACKFDWTRIKTIELTPRTFRYDGPQNLAYIRENQQKGKIIIINNVVSFTDASADPNMITREGSGLKEVAGENPYEYNIKFDNGVDFWKKLRTYNSSGKYNIALYDIEGNKVFTQTKSGEIKGFYLGMFFTGKYKAKDGVVSSEYGTMLQYEDYKEMDRVAWIAADLLDYSPSDIDGANDVTITVEPVAVGATTLVFTPKLADKTHLLEGLVWADNLKVLKTTSGGVVSTVTPAALSYTTNAGKVTATIPAAVIGDIFTIDLHDNTLNAQIIEIVGVLYKAEAASVVTA